MALPSSTVENYLKAIFQAQLHLEKRSDLVPMGQLAAALGVVPGTATTMVKTLADSGLAKYEPYAGVRLTASGERLAALVVRRHRLIELFLVQVMGMSWTDVHEEAELLEHAVSDRLIERIDEMLGHPEADPHGDPIPDAQGVLERRPFDTLLTCPLNAPVTVRRVTDQDPEFLRFVERRDLKPGEVVEVVERDAAADSVRVRGRKDRAITIGARAASKVLVQLATSAALIMLLAGSAMAQQPASPAPATAPPTVEPFAILDNSFFVEEAFNQERGIFQNIFGFVRQNGNWALSFTQEWPAPTIRHQLSYTVAAQSEESETNLGDVYLNYRFQALEEGPGRPAFSPRVSAIVGDNWGLQFNLPFSKQVQDFYFHWNAGLTWRPRGENGDLSSPFLAASAIYRVRPMFNLMVEAVQTWDAEEVAPSVVEREGAFVISPGTRFGWNLAPDTQLILGAAIPITRFQGETSAGFFAYCSYELPFRK
jgi:DtxR family Mn-dependent transcriptional regulator